MSEEKPSPLTIQHPALESPTLTTSQRFHAWRAAVGDEQAITHICDLVVAGSNLNAFCGANGFSYTTAARWIRQDKDRAAAYDQATEDRADLYAERVLEVAERDCSAPVTDKEGNFLGTQVDKGKVAQARNEMDALKWIAGKCKPKRWGDKIQVDATMDVRTATSEQLAGELQRLGLGSVAAVLMPQAQGGAADGQH